MRVSVLTKNENERPKKSIYVIYSSCEVEVSLDLDVDEKNLDLVLAQS